MRRKLFQSRRIDSLHKFPLVSITLDVVAIKSLQMSRRQLDKFIEENFIEVSDI